MHIKEQGSLYKSNLGGLKEKIEPLVEKFIIKGTFTKDSVQDLQYQLVDLLIQEELGEKTPPPTLIYPLKEKLPPLSIYYPPPIEYIPASRQAMAGGVGVFLGTIALRPLLLATGIDEKTALFLASLLGASLFHYLLAQFSTSQTWRRSLLLLTGVASITEIFSLLSPFRLPSIIPKVRWKRYLLYLSIPLLYLTCSPKERYDKRDLKESIEQALTLWLPYCGTLIREEYKRLTQEKNQGREEIKKIIPSLYKLHHSPKEELETALLELFQILNSLGYESLRDEPAFKKKEYKGQYFYWDNKLIDQYYSFGQIEEGDLVRVEKPVVMKKGQLIEKGLVRRFHQKRSLGGVIDG